MFGSYCPPVLALTIRPCNLVLTFEVDKGWATDKVTEFMRKALVNAKASVVVHTRDDVGHLLSVTSNGKFTLHSAPSENGPTHQLPDAVYRLFVQSLCAIREGEEQNFHVEDETATLEIKVDPSVTEPKADEAERNAQDAWMLEGPQLYSVVNAADEPDFYDEVLRHVCMATHVTSNDLVYWARGDTLYVANKLFGQGFPVERDGSSASFFSAVEPHSAESLNLLSPAAFVTHPNMGGPSANGEYTLPIAVQVSTAYLMDFEQHPAYPEILLAWTGIVLPKSDDVAGGVAAFACRLQYGWCVDDERPATMADAKAVKAGTLRVKPREITEFNDLVQAATRTLQFWNDVAANPVSVQKAEVDSMVPSVTEP